MKPFFTAIVTLIVLGVNPVFVSAEPGNKITGIVVLEEESGETPLDNLKVLLYSHGKEKSNVVQSETADGGKFKFDNLTSEELSYYLTVKYEGVNYGSDVVRFPGGETSSKHIKIAVYNSSKDRKTIIISDYLITVDVDEHRKKFLIEEKMTILNESSDIFIGERELPHDKREVLRIKLPGKYDKLKYLKGINDNSSFLSDSGILDTTPLKPGSRKIAFKYEVPFNPPEQELIWTTNFQIEKLKISFRNIGLNINSEKLLFDNISFVTPKDKSRKKGVYFKNMVAVDIPTDTVFSLKISGFPEKKKDIRPIIALLCICLLFVACRKIRK